jgi:peptidyl-prolyl cis-trans isomerase B (cyclophilin B)
MESSMFKKLSLIVFLFTFMGLTMTALSDEHKSYSPDRKIDTKAKHPQYVITVTQKNKELGKIVLELYPEVAPLHCKNFDSLVESNFYDGTAFHRVVPGFVIQGGDPNTKNKDIGLWGQGDPSQKTVPAEFSDVSHQRGMLSAARTPDPNSATSQFFICVADCSRLDKQYTVYGKVLSGMDVADKIVSSPTDGAEHPKDKITMTIKKNTKETKARNKSKKTKKSKK